MPCCPWRENSHAIHHNSDCDVGLKHSLPRTDTACHAQMKTVSEVGAHSCGKYLATVHGHAPGTGRSIDLPEGRAYDEHIRYAEWVLGFLTATNWWVIDERNQIHPDGAAVDVWIRK